MKRSRYQSRLNKKLEEDNKARTDVSRKSLPKKNEQTLVPEITFSEIMPNETIQETNDRVRRSSRLNLTSQTSVVETPSAAAGTSGSTKDQTFSSESRSAKKNTANALNAKTSVKPSVDSNSGPEIENPSFVNVSQTAKSYSAESVKESDRGSSATISDTARPGQDGSTEVAARRRISETETQEKQGQPLRTRTQQKTSNIPIPEGKPKEPPVKPGGLESDMKIDDAAVNDENDPKNSFLDSSAPNKDHFDESQSRKRDAEDELQSVSMRALRKKKDINYSLNRPKSKQAGRAKPSRNDEVKEQEEIPAGNLHDSEDKSASEITNHELKSFRIVVERIEIPDMSSGDPGDGSQLEPSAAQDEDDQDVSLETLEIRKKIEKKILGDNESSDEEDHGEHGAVNSEKLFDTLVKPSKRVPSAETLDSSSYYQGTIPSRLFSPVKETRQETEPAEPADGLTERFEAFKQFNSQKTSSQASSMKPSGSQVPVVPSFTLEEEATNDLAEVTNRAITLCMEEDSDMDLDVVMKSKSRRSAAVGNEMVDPVFCDIGTSMGLPAAEQKDAESLVLMIDSTSRESSQPRQNQPEEVMHTSKVESMSKKNDSCDFVSEDDQGEELKNPRKSKLQSTLLPSPKRHAEVAVGTGPSLMATTRESGTFQDERAKEVIVILDKDDDLGSPVPPSAAPYTNSETVQQFAEEMADVEENDFAPDSGERMQAESQPDADVVEASFVFEAPPELLEALHQRRASPPEDEPYETDGVLSEEERAPETEKASNDAVIENKRRNEQSVDEEEKLMDAEQEDAARNDSEEKPDEGGREGNEEERGRMSQKGASSFVDGAEINPAETSDKAPRARTSSGHEFLLQEEPLQRRDPLEGMDGVSLLDMIGNDLDALDLPGSTMILSQDLSEQSSSKRKKPLDETPKLLVYKETPRSKVKLSGDYKLGREIRGSGKRDTPSSLYSSRKPRLSRRTLFDEAANMPPEILPSAASMSVISPPTEKRRSTFALDSTRLPSFEDAYVVTEFDTKELKRRGEELFQLAARNLLDRNPEDKSVIQHAFEELLTTQQGPIKQMMSLLVRKYALKEACEARKEPYLSTQVRLARTRKYITDTAIKLMPENETNAVKVFGFNPFEFKEPPPEAVREINRRKASEDEEHLKKKYRRTVE